MKKASPNSTVSFWLLGDKTVHQVKHVTNKHIPLLHVAVFTFLVMAPPFTAEEGMPQVGTFNKADSRLSIENFGLYVTWY